MPVKVKRPDDIQGAYDDLGSSALHSAETNTSSPYTDAGIDQAGAYANDPANASDAANTIRQQEETSPSGWANNFTGGGGEKSGGRFGAIGKLTRKFGPTGAIGGAIAGLGIAATMVLSPSMLFVHMKEVIVDKFSHQNTVLDIRTNKIVTNKLSSTALNNCAAKAPKYFCKFNRMSNRMLQRMADQGMIPVDKNGDPLDLKDRKVWGQKPYGFFDADNKFGLKETNGKWILVAKDFRSVVGKNAQIASAFRRAYNPRWEAFWDSVYDGFLKKVGFGTKASKIEGDTEEEVKENLKNKVGEISGDATNVDAKEENGDDEKTKEQNASTNDLADEANSTIDEAGTKTTEELSKEMTGKLKGGATIFISMYCMALGSENIAKALKAIQMVQLISFGLLFLQIADEIKAGDGNPAKIAAVGSLFTASLISSKGAVVKKSAMNSDSMLYALAGNTSFKSKTSDYNRWVPGGGMIKFLNIISDKVKTGNATADKTLKGACKAYNSTAGQAVALALNFTLAGAAIALVTEGVMRLPVVQDAMANLFKTLAGKIIDDTIAYEDLGNAGASAMIQSTVEGGNAGAMMPLTTTQAVAYIREERKTQLADAAIDRATHSPFDATNPNTFMGSIVSQLIPYSASLTSGPLSTVGAMSGIVGSTFGSMLAPTTSADDGNVTEADLSKCQDPSIKKAKIAAGPLCDVYYGIPLEYVNGIDPAENVQYMEKKGYTDPETGEIVGGSKLDDYLMECKQGDGSAANADCIIDSKEKARLALYFIDNRIQKSMDGEDSSDTESDTTSDTPPATSSEGWGLPWEGATAGFGYREMYTKGVHKGVDFPAAKGTPVKAVHSGKVTLRYEMGAGCGWATVIKVDGEDSLYVGYQHVDTTVKVGQRVSLGQVIGEVGKFCGTGTHAHISIETKNRVSIYADTGARDTSLDPKDYLPI